MLRRRDSSMLHAAKREEKLCAHEYFGEVLTKLKQLQHVMDETREPHLNTHIGPTFEKDNRIIDFILVYDKTALRPSKEKVNAYLKQLVREGFSTEGGESEFFDHLIFIRIHCNRAKLVKAGVILDFNLAFVSKDQELLDYDVFFNFDFLFNELTKPMLKSDIARRAPDSTFNRKPRDITYEERILVAYELMKNARYGPDEDEYGIQSLLHKNYLHACFPLHDGIWQWTEEGPLNDRQLLMKYWASSSNWFKLQPLNLIKQYFGPEVAFYFAFLGYFNKMLIVPAILGISSLGYGLLTYGDSRNYRSVEICASNLTICPPCHDLSICHYEVLNNECHTSQIAYVFDNFGTVIYVLFWCFWSTIIYGKWKRREAVLLFRWNLMEVENELNLRPQYLARTLNAQTKKRMKDDGSSTMIMVREKVYLRILRYCLSGFTLFGLLLIILAVIYCAIILRWFTGKIIGRFDGQFSFQWRILLVTTIGNLFITVFVCFVEDSFFPLAHFITDFENHRTQHEYEMSFVYKYACLCFITSYSFICYTAFLKGSFFSYPGHETHYEVMGILSYDVEKIHTATMSVTYQWTVMTIGKEFWRLFVPKMNTGRKKKRKTKYQHFNEVTRIWEEEYLLESYEHSFLLEENMKIILQYGYLALFAGANPLGPIAYFFYNCWALRYDAKRVLLRSRRVVPLKTAGFGPWLKLIQLITIMGLGTNVFFLAFTSNFVPELSHWMNPYFKNFIDFTFSVFAVDDFPTSFGADVKRGREGTFCLYKGNRTPPNSTQPYTNTVQHWNKISIRFITVIAIQSFMIIFCGLLLFAMSDVPQFIKESIRHRAHLKEKEREEKYMRERSKKNTDNPNIAESFTVITY